MPVVALAGVGTFQSEGSLLDADSTGNEDGATSVTRMRVLVVDDQPFVRKTIAFMLTQAGVKQIREAADGHEALALLSDRSRPFDIIFCDLQMPGRDGIEILRDLSRFQPEAQVVLVSSEDADVLKAAHSLASEYGLQVLGSLSKPVAADQIRTVLEIAGRKPRQRQERAQASVGVEDVERALAEDEFEVFVQPKVRLSDGGLEGVEALSRWRHPEHGLIGPALFIPLAEQHGLIDALTDKVVSSLIALGRQWDEKGLAIDLACNLSVRSLQRLDLPERLVAQVEAARISPSRVVLEITESHISDDPKTMLDIATRLRLKKFQLAIDDFGTGYSSLHQLRRLPFSELKIDQAFVTGAGADPTARSILESSIDLARKLDMKIVAEGVENQEDWDLVAALGCDIAQGYLIARPMPGGELFDWNSDRGTG